MAPFFEVLASINLRISQCFLFVHDPLVERFLKLVFLGEYGNHSRLLSQLFMSLGLLHVLVLSGSQVNSLKRVHDLFYSIGVFPLTKRRKFLGPITFCHRASWMVLSLLYGNLTQWTPPVTRALVLSGALGLSRPLSLTWKIILGFSLQISFFPSHAVEKSFYLSWGCWLAKALTSKWGWSEFFQNLILAGFFWVAIGLLHGASIWLLAKQLPLVLLTAVTLGPWIEKLLFPLGLFLIFFGLWAGLGSWLLGLEVVFGHLFESLGILILPILEGLASSLLVGLWAFRYIWGTL